MNRILLLLKSARQERHFAAYEKSSWQVSSAATSTSTSLGGVVEAEGGAAGRGQPEMRHQRLGAVVPGPHRDALAVDHGRDVVRMRRPSSVKEKIAPLPARLPWMFSQLSPWNRALA